MGAVLEKLFINPAEFTVWPIPKILFLLVVYGFVLFKASNMISDGSELLLLIPSLAGIVGSVVLPVLGAVPDGMIVLFSGLGPREEAQEQLSVGVGALAGSTVMLLTIPWILTLVAGRVSLDSHGKGAYSKKQKLTPPNSLHPWRTGTNVNASVRISGLIMIATAISYLIIQGPAFFIGCSKADESCDPEGERAWAIAGFCVCLLFFVAYLVYQVITANRQSNKDRVDQVRQDAITHSVLSVSAAFADVLFGGEAGGESSALLQETGEAAVRFQATLRAFFTRHDADHNGVIDAAEMRTLLAELGEHPTHAEFDRIMHEVDSNHNGVIEFDEFVVAMRNYVRSQVLRDAASKQGDIEQGKKDTGEPAPAAAAPSSSTSEAAPAPMEAEKDGDAGEEEEEEVPDDLKHLTPKQQRLRVLWRACWMMLVGVVLVVLFSDPMVDVLSALGKEVKVPPFYIAFILAPLASNASEIIASFNYAKKKTVRTATISCESLLGAAVMNNTFCLSIFLTLVWARGLAWSFSAETIAILVVEVSMLTIALIRTQRLAFGFVCLILYPLSLGLVVLLEHLGYN